MLIQENLVGRGKVDEAPLMGESEPGRMVNDVLPSKDC
jgi:hypothetical protein